MIVAPHGGGIEPVTSEIVKALAGSEFSLYCFEGLKVRGSRNLHITSTYFNDPVCLGLANRSQTVVTVHGCQGKSETVFVGGLDENLKTLLIKTLRSAGFKAVRDNSRHSGSDARNICNRGLSGKGVQLEITKGLRQRMFKGLRRNEKTERTPLFKTFVQLLREVLLEVNELIYP